MLKEPKTKNPVKNDTQTHKKKKHKAGNKNQRAYHGETLEVTQVRNSVATQEQTDKD